jgi:hypothetical protein
MGENLLNKLPSAEKIKHPISLLAFSLSALVLVIYNITPNIYVDILSIIIVGIISSLIIFKYEDISNVEFIKREYEGLKNNYEQLEINSNNAQKLFNIIGIDEIPEEPTKLPNNLCLTNETQLTFWNEKVKPSLQALGFDIEEHKRKNTPIGNYYYYTNSSYQGKDVAFIHLKNAFFLYGEKWRESGWVSRLIQVLDSKVIIIISDVDMICYASLHEKEDIEATSDVKVMFIGKSMINMFMASEAKLFEDFIKNRVVEGYLK